MRRILIVEDDSVIRRELKILLENALYQVEICDTSGQITEQILAAKPDLILLDVNLPGISGFEICTCIREQLDIPIIFLTGRNSSEDELKGMLTGGDDYITKPYQAPVLLARISAVLRRTKGSDSKENMGFVHKGVRLDVAGCSLSCGEKCVELTKNEMKILHMLFQHAGAYVMRMDLIEYLWENQIFIDDNTLSVNVTRIRDKLKKIGVTDFIETKRGMGYRI
ncbi:MAG: response regulator transcription factor [Dorea sp.]